jgi:hypothetical protein
MSSKGRALHPVDLSKKKAYLFVARNRSRRAFTWLDRATTSWGRSFPAEWNSATISLPWTRTFVAPTTWRYLPGATTS